MQVISRRGDRIDESAFDRMCYWIRERESIRIKKEAGLPRPWTDDPLLATYRWCNVRRMDDKVSRFLLDWHNSVFGIPFHNRLHAIALGRYINWPPSLLALGNYPVIFLPNKTNRILTERSNRGEKVFTGAYIINGALGGDKITQITHKVIGPLWTGRMDFAKDDITESLENLWNMLAGRPGIGSFMAGQITADARHVYFNGAWLDRHTWAPQGPGSKRGINRLMGQPTDARLPYIEWLDVLRLAYAKAAARLPSLYLRLELMDQQSIMCEFDKYERLRKGEGTVRARYQSQGGW